MGIRKTVLQDPLKHPNFSMPALPASSKDSPGTFLAGVEWALQAAANYVSPPKVDGEDEEFACEDLASAIRGPFREHLRQAVHKT